MLMLKLLLVPLFLSLVSLASARWGPAIGGWLAGLPVVGGPILFLLAIERGPVFAADSAVAALNGLCGAIAFALVYAWAAVRLSWLESAISAVGAWLMVTAVLAVARPGLAVGALLVTVILFLVPRCFPTPLPFRPAVVLGRRELGLRMLAGALLTLFTTAVARPLGPTLTGMLAVFPILTLILAVFSHRNSGAGFCTILLRSMMGGLYSFVGFCVVLALTIPRLGTYTGFAVAVAAALGMHGLVRRWGMARRRMPR
ncbi:MAG: hypothetical protein KDK91_12720 [Gammaproteobacteria bacterium]|nr:hypothetical protein [Gammaproteobacteria bacterium]